MSGVLFEERADEAGDLIDCGLQQEVPAVAMALPSGV
jgi:hypothetical protein